MQVGRIEQELAPRARDVDDTDPLGRLDDTFVYPDGTAIHPHVFRHCLGHQHLVEYQVRQTARGADIAVVTSGAVDTDAVSVSPLNLTPATLSPDEVNEADYIYLSEAQNAPSRARERASTLAALLGGLQRLCINLCRDQKNQSLGYLGADGIEHG